jgi:hypothetical protein
MPRTHEPGGRDRKTSGNIYTAPGTFKPIKRRNRIGEQFAPRTIAMLRSPAYCALSLSARRFLDRLEIELAAHGGRDNGKLPLTYIQLEEYGLYGNGIAPAIREAVALGFAEVTQQGRASFTAEYRHPSKYRITYRPTDDGEQTDEWERIRTLEDAEKIAQDARLTPKKAKRHTLKQRPNLDAKTAPKVDTIAAPQNRAHKLGAKIGATSIFSGGSGRYALMDVVADVVERQLDQLGTRASAPEGSALASERADDWQKLGNIISGLH